MSDKEKIEAILKEAGYTLYKLSAVSGIPYATLRAITTERNSYLRGFNNRAKLSKIYSLVVEQENV